MKFKINTISGEVIFYFLILSAVIFIIYGKYFESSNSKDLRIQYKIQNEIKCDPYIRNLSIFNVSINNEIYPKFIPLYNNPRVNYSCLNSDKSSKIILLWNTWFGDATFAYGIGKKVPFEKNRCPVTNCEITNDKSRLIESDLIVFHMPEGQINPLPSKRTTNQRWVFYSYESPANTESMQRFDNLFNLSATYKHDSNFTTIYLYSNYIWTENENFDDKRNFSEDKTELAVAVVSNCFAKSGRLNYIKELQKSIHVTIFGNCGKPCPTFYDNGTKGDCKEIISRKYKFYLAFENSLCQDYVTEKFFDILRYDIIPVVYGYGSYSTYVPKSGFINALDFPKAEYLAEFLIFLDKNETAYNSFFKWKKNIKFVENGPHVGPMCELCLRLNLDKYEGISNHVITNMSEFWSPDRNCKIVFD